MRPVSGVAAVEFAIVLPLLMLILLGVIDFGVMLYDKAMITNAARESARAGIVLRNPRLNQAAIQLVATNYCSTFLLRMFGTATTCTAVVSNLDAVGGGTQCVAFAQRLRVVVTYPYQGPVLSLLGLAGPINLSSTTVMNCE